jgi:hypothetical protein
MVEIIDFLTANVKQTTTTLCQLSMPRTSLPLLPPFPLSLPLPLLFPILLPVSIQYACSSLTLQSHSLPHSPLPSSPSLPSILLYSLLSTVNVPCSLRFQFQYSEEQNGGNSKKTVCSPFRDIIPHGPFAVKIYIPKVRNRIPDSERETRSLQTF